MDSALLVCKKSFLI
uniref:Uncharacterized protein n=1 Tax=Anguilla anguilla TaxID=7936 RepID=A0A0E9V4Y5_ANGAN